MRDEEEDTTATRAAPSLQLCDDLTLDLDAYARTGLRVGVWASSGRGKSFGVGVFCEELLAAGVPLVAIDPEGELHTLREGFRVLVIGGDRGDLPLPDAPELARAVLDRCFAHGVSLVIDLSERVTSRAQQEGARPWLEALWARQSGRRSLTALVVEEVHLFAPQSGSSSTAEIMQRLAKQGRKRGVIIVAASQRTQAVSKEFMSQLNFPAIGGFETERDYDAVKAVVDGHPFETFRALPPGEFFLPDVGGFHRWRARHTSHGGDAPGFTASELDAPARHDADLEALVSALREEIERPADAPPPPTAPDAAARAKVRALEDELRATRESLASTQEEVRQLKIALQVAGVLKVVVQQQVVPPSVEVAKPAPAPPPPAPLPAPPPPPAPPSAERVMASASIQSLLARAEELARRRSPRAVDFFPLAPRLLANGADLTALELAQRSGSKSLDQIRRAGVALHALVQVGYATLSAGRYAVNAATVRRYV